MITIETNTPEAQRRIAELGPLLQGRAIRAAMGGAAKLVLQAHFRGLDASRANKLGGKRTHFYADAAKGTNYQVTENGVDVTITKTGIRQRLRGGKIVPVNGSKYLTIPARSEAYGRRAREFDNLRFIKFKSGSAALVERDASTLRKSKKSKTRNETGTVGGLIMFWLVKEVTQRADPSVLPDRSSIIDAAFNAAIDHINAKAKLT